MDRLQFITHHGQRILLLDFTNCNPEQIAEISDQAPALITREAAGSVRVVADFTGAEFSREAVEHIKVATAIDKRYIKRAAWVLDHNMPKALFESVRTFSARNFPVFDTREEAFDFVISGEDSRGAGPDI
jgi:hypothetical protein